MSYRASPSLLRLAPFAAIVSAMALPFALARCSDSTTVTERTVSGAQITIGQGTARTELIIARGAPSTLAIVLSETALSGLPVTMTELVLPLPAEATGLPFDHVTLNWNPMGHPPAGIYDREHFDIHYYMITVPDRDRITAADAQFAAKTARQPAADFVPPNYSGDPNAIPRMGVHWWDRGAPERNGQLFTRAVLYGFYDGTMIFLEPMVTKAFLETRPNVTADLAVPARYPKAGNYPTRYGVRYDAARREYRIELTGFLARS